MRERPTKRTLRSYKVIHVTSMWKLSEIKLNNNDLPIYSIFGDCKKFKVVVRSSNITFRADKCLNKHQIFLI